VDRHELDLASLVMGVALFTVAVGVLLAEWSGADVDLAWVLPAVLLGVGLAGLAGSLAGSITRRENPDPAATTDPSLDTERH